MSDHPGCSGPEDGNSSKSSNPLDHTNLLTRFLDGSEFDRHGGDENYMDTDMYAGVPEEPSTPAGAEEPGAPTGAQQDGMPFVEHFPSGTTGVPICDMDQGVPVFQALHSNLGPDNIWHPFQSQRDWDFARWAKNRGLLSTAVTELLALDGVHTLQCKFKAMANNDKLGG